MTALSIIVPIYNVEKYLAKCLESVLNTEWNDLTFEIIVIDDASPDGSLAIAQQFARQYPEIRIISQPNKGLGGARNTGITAAHGQYLFLWIPMII
ncbi:glycosyltransferase [Kaistella anthropi]|nr:glycosyltransferase [Kaistella anthropi]